MPAKTIVAVSGGFDPIHIGHIRYLQEAQRLGTELVVILNNDNWLINKKGFVFMPEEERKEILEAISGVSRVVITDHEVGESDRSVCRTLRELNPHIFANGGDRRPDGDPVPEVALCEELGIQMVYNVGRGKVQSSSWLVGKVADAALEKKMLATLPAPASHAMTPVAELFANLSTPWQISVVVATAIVVFVGALNLLARLG
jgi:D-beta-D-heptose 7-phosphate kinase/D-beta-D-heptose 1-phosphate adenosyltransferase